MNTNKLKVLLCFYTIGMVGCNKIGNPSYMDGGGDRKDEKKQKDETSFSIEQSGTSVVVLQGDSKGHNEILRDSLSSMKSLADTAEQVAINKQEAVERAIKAATDAKIAAEAARKAADDAEKNTPEFGGDNTLYNKAFQNSLSSMKGLADTAEQVAINKQEAVERAIKAATDAKIAAEAARKAADDAEKNTPEFGGGDASTSEEMGSTSDTSGYQSHLQSQAQSQ